MNIEKINISGNEYDIKDAKAQSMITDEFSDAQSYTAGDYCIYENALYKFTSDKEAGAWDSGKVTATNIDTELSGLNSRGTLTALYTSPKEITSPADHITLSGSISNFRQLIFLFGYTSTEDASTPIEIPTELFRAGYAASYSFTDGESSCWGRASFVDDNTIFLLGSRNGYIPYLLAVYGVS